MTSQETRDIRDDGILETILEKVESIEGDIQEILDRLTDYVESTRYGAGWYGTDPSDPAAYA